MVTSSNQVEDFLGPRQLSGKNQTQSQSQRVWVQVPKRTYNHLMSSTIFIWVPDAMLMSSKTNVGYKYNNLNLPLFEFVSPMLQCASYPKKSRRGPKCVQYTSTHLNCSQTMTTWWKYTIDWSIQNAPTRTWDISSILIDFSACKYWKCSYTTHPFAS